MSSRFSAEGTVIRTCGCKIGAAMVLASLAVGAAAAQTGVSLSPPEFSIPLVPSSAAGTEELIPRLGVPLTETKALVENTASTLSSRVEVGVQSGQISNAVQEVNTNYGETGDGEGAVRRSSASTSSPSSFQMPPRRSDLFAGEAMTERPKSYSAVRSSMTPAQLMALQERQLPSTSSVSSSDYASSASSLLKGSQARMARQVKDGREAMVYPDTFGGASNSSFGGTSNSSRELFPLFPPGLTAAIQMPRAQTAKRIRQQTAQVNGLGASPLETMLHAPLKVPTVKNALPGAAERLARTPSIDVTEIPQ